ncbi:hypothetical protein GA0111570_1224 [Raineyella antarctica]|uniref:Uncharacterized protein n=1 Tax=Raineyella antarctica TaxID=1577474 RepID=A0A1G6ITB3_9ACTN|nr:hypothetical protein [Raineyella antarctica]SDC09006.1 hypothetical protein GA0111570_1224 [Raineyella antarctica]
MGEWTIEYEGDRFEKCFLGLPEYEQAVLEAAITHVLAVRGIDICNGEWGKPLGDGLSMSVTTREVRCSARGGRSAVSWGGSGEGNVSP